MTKLITFGQLLQIKREAMGLNMKEVTERIGGLNEKLYRVYRLYTRIKGAKQWELER